MPVSIYILLTVLTVHLYSTITLIQLGGWPNLLAAIISVLIMPFEAVALLMISEALARNAKKGDKNERIHD